MNGVCVTSSFFFISLCCAQVVNRQSVWYLFMPNFQKYKCFRINETFLKA